MSSSAQVRGVINSHSATTTAADTASRNAARAIKRAAVKVFPLLMTLLAFAAASLMMTGRASAVPASVDNYLRSMHQQRMVPVISDDQLLRLGRAVCADVNGSHVPVVQESTTLMQATGWTRIQANLLIGSAIPNLCPAPGVFN